MSKCEEKNYNNDSKEIWKTLSYMNNKYKISSHGNIVNIKTNKKKKCNVHHRDGILVTDFTISKKKYKKFSIHRLVYEIFNKKIKNT